MTRRPHHCLAPTYGGHGVCMATVRHSHDHCRRHGGPWVDPMVRRFMDGESMADLAGTLNPEVPMERRIEYVEKKIRRWMGDYE